MTNRFKENTRFASLIQDKPVINKKKEKNEQYKIEKNDQYKFEKNDNSFKNNYHRENNSFYKSYKERREDIMKKVEEEEIMKKAEEEKRKEEEKKVALAIESFPELLVNSKTVVVENTSNFLDKLKTFKKVDTPVKNVLKQGWTELTLDKVTNSTIMVSNIEKNKYIKTVEDLAYDVLDHLVYLYEDRKATYIGSWGEDEWDRMFTFSNYDYHYFDKLDEIYENNIDSDHEYENEDFEEDEYWKKY